MDFVAGSITLTNLSTEQLVGMNGNQMFLLAWWELAGFVGLKSGLTQRDLAGQPLGKVDWPVRIVERKTAVSGAAQPQAFGQHLRFKPCVCGSPGEQFLRQAGGRPGCKITGCAMPPAGDGAVLGKGKAGSGNGS